MSGALIFTLGFVVVVVAWSARRLARWRKARRVAALPGRHREDPLRVSGFAELERTVDKSRCACGGYLDKVGESHLTDALWLVRARCGRCEAPETLYFEVPN